MSNPVNRYCRHLLLSAVITFLTACGAPDPGLSGLPPDAVILAFGDSLTSGTGAGKGDDFPAQLAGLIEREVINAGVSGELSAAGRERLPRLLDRYQPDLVILCHGGNDMLQQRDPETTADNLHAMIDKIRAAGSEVLLLAVPEPGLLPAAAAVYDRLAADTSTPVMTGILADILSSPSLKSDAVHPNKAGYAKLARAIATKLRQAGAL